ncbi:MAG: hypothetical protein ACRD19_03805, partial [Terriglobia bacterium]
GKSLRQMFEMKGSLSPSSSSHAIDSGEQEISLVAGSLQKLTSALEAAQKQGAATYSGLGRSTQEWSNVATKATSQMLALLTRQNLLETGSVTAHARAEQAKSLASVTAFKQLAPVQAAVQVAKALGDLGDLNFWGAAEHFASAAMWGTVGAAQVAGMLSGSGAGGRGSRSSSGSRRGNGSGVYGDSDAGISEPVLSLASGAASALSGPSGQLTVAIMGDSDAGEWLAKTLNTAVEQRGVQLTSTRSTRSPYAQG